MAQYYYQQLQAFIGRKYRILMLALACFVAMC